MLKMSLCLIFLIQSLIDAHTYFPIFWVQVQFSHLPLSLSLSYNTLTITLYILNLLNIIGIPYVPCLNITQYHLSYPAYSVISLILILIYFILHVTLTLQELKPKKHVFVAFFSYLVQHSIVVFSNSRKHQILFEKWIRLCHLGKQPLIPLVLDLPVPFWPPSPTHITHTSHTAYPTTVTYNNHPIHSTTCTCQHKCSFMQAKLPILVDFTYLGFVVDVHSSSDVRSELFYPFLFVLMCSMAFPCQNNSFILAKIHQFCQQPFCDLPLPHQIFPSDFTPIPQFYNFTIIVTLKSIIKTPIYLKKTLITVDNSLDLISFSFLFIYYCLLTSIIQVVCFIHFDNLIEPQPLNLKSSVLTILILLVALKPHQENSLQQHLSWHFTDIALVLSPGCVILNPFHQSIISHYQELCPIPGCSKSTPHISSLNTLHCETLKIIYVLWESNPHILCPCEVYQPLYQGNMEFNDCVWVNECFWCLSRNISQHSSLLMIPNHY
ncbi:putative signal peptide protein [Puccinia sorghi]|uniref:Putative signal peptide protein n=1 Tax=Puccinia sorghi TaxID=27349 RepID=A0A0L6VIT1_9BASI|nr:putative signal peptide protein [Puccinia sorghi]